MGKELLTHRSKGLFERCKVGGTVEEDGPRDFDGFGGHDFCSHCFFELKIWIPSMDSLPRSFCLVFGLVQIHNRVESGRYVGFIDTLDKVT